MELENSISKKINETLLNGLNIKLEVTEDGTSELKNMPITFLPYKQQQENKIANICIIKVPKEDSGTLKVFFFKQLKIPQIGERYRPKIQDPEQSHMDKHPQIHFKTHNKLL